MKSYQMMDCVGWWIGGKLYRFKKPRNREVSRRMLARIMARREKWVYSHCITARGGIF